MYVRRDIPNEFIKKKRVGVPRRTVRIAGRWAEKKVVLSPVLFGPLAMNVRCARCELKNHSCVLREKALEKLVF